MKKKVVKKRVNKIPPAKDIIPIGGYNKKKRSKKQGFQKLNQIWMLRNRAGLKPDFTPEELWTAFTEFAAWCDGNPMTTVKTVKQGMKKVMKTTERHIIPYTREGFRLYIDKGKHYLIELRRRSYDFADVLDRIEEAIATRVINGGMVGKFHGNLAARYVSLEDNIHVEDKRDEVRSLFPTAEEFALQEAKIQDSDANS